MVEPRSRVPLRARRGSPDFPQFGIRGLVEPRSRVPQRLLSPEDDHRYDHGPLYARAVSPSESTSKHSNGISSQQWHLFYTSRSFREVAAGACITSTTRLKVNRLRATHATRDGPCGHVFATILGRMWPEWTGPEEPGAPSPFAWLERRNVGLRGTTNNRQAILCTGGFQLTDQISGWDPRKGTYCPKWEV